MDPTFGAGINIAVKIPKSKYEKTVAFYREVLKFEVEEKSIKHPTVSRTHKVDFGHNIIWLDCVDNYSHSETWLQLTVPDIKEATNYLHLNGVNTCDELEELPANMHWITDPAGTVFNLQQRYTGFDFEVDRQNNTIHIKREFDCSLQLVWQAWTTAELLDQWWGPRPWRSETKTMDFRENGLWHYAMVSPEGEKHWAKATYIAIEREKSFTARDGFCDENGTMDPAFPQNFWESRFQQTGERVQVDMIMTFDSVADLERTIEMGFKEGMTAGLDQLDELLRRVQQR